MLSQARDSLVIAATAKMSRKARLSIGTLAVGSSWLFFAIFIGGPWGLFEKNMARPICEQKDGFGKAPEHWVPQIGWYGTTGGWKADYDATWYDLATLVTQGFVLLILPLTTTTLCRQWNGLINTQTSERTTIQEVANHAEEVAGKSGYKIHHRVFMLLLGIAVTVILVGQSISGVRFGVAWAQGVVAQEWNADQSGWMFDEVKIAEHVYDQTVSTMALVVACGLVFATALQRHLINGVGCYSASLFFGWIALIVIFALPITIFAANRSIFNEHVASKDCNAVFPRDSHEMSNDLCVTRFWTLLIGGIMFVSTIALITLLGMIEAVPNLLKTRVTASVIYTPLEGENEVFRKGAPFRSSEGYRSETQPFFNYLTPKLHVPHPRMPGL